MNYASTILYIIIFVILADYAEYTTQRMSYLHKIGCKLVLEYTYLAMLKGNTISPYVRLALNYL